MNGLTRRSQPQTEQRHAGPLGEPRRTQQKYGIEALGFCTDYYANNCPIYLLYNQAKRQRLAAGARMESSATRSCTPPTTPSRTCTRPDWTPRPTSVTSARPTVPPGLGLLPLEQILAGRRSTSAYLQQAVHADAGERRAVWRSGAARHRILHGNRPSFPDNTLGRATSAARRRRRLRPLRAGFPWLKGGRTPPT